MNKHFILLTALLGTLSGSVGAQRPAYTADELYTEGKQLYLRGNYAAAEQTLEQFLTLPTADEKGRTRAEEAEYLTVCIAYHLKEADRVEQLQRFLSKYPDTPHANRLHALVGNILYADGMYDRALESYEKSDLEQLGDNERDEATLYKAICLLKTGNTDEAYTLLTVVQTVSTQYETDARYYKAYIDYTYGRYDEALPALETLKIHPLYGKEANMYAADIHLQQGNYKEAGEIAGDYPEVLEMKRIAGEAAYGLDDYATASRLLDEYTSSLWEGGKYVCSRYPFAAGTLQRGR